MEYIEYNRKRVSEQALKALVKWDRKDWSHSFRSCGNCGTIHHWTKLGVESCPTCKGKTVYG